MTNKNLAPFDQEQEHKYISPTGYDIEGNPATAETAIAADEAKEQAGLARVIAFPEIYGAHDKEDDSGDPLGQMFKRDVEDARRAFKEASPSKRGLIIGGFAASGLLLGYLVTGGNPDLPGQVAERVHNLLALVK